MWGASVDCHGMVKFCHAKLKSMSKKKKKSLAKNPILTKYGISDACLMAQLMDKKIVALLNPSLVSHDFVKIS